MTTVAVRSRSIFWRISTALRRKPRRRTLLAGERSLLEGVRGDLAAGSVHLSGVVAFDEMRLDNAADVRRLLCEAMSLSIDEVVLCAPDASAAAIVAFVRILTEAGLAVTVVSCTLSGVAERLSRRANRLAGCPYVRFAPRAGGAAAVVKRMADVAAASLLLVLLAPLWGVVSLLLLLTQGRPVVFAQERVGGGGRRFAMYKFRTMMDESRWPAAEQLRAMNTRRGPMFKAADDPRVTSVGRWLRRLCIDETPQLINVLKGDMSLVGARPPLPDEVERYEPWHYERLRGCTGITGLWQTSDRSKLDFEDVVLLDSYYSRSSGPFLDLRILAVTVWAVLSGRAAS
jgi:lipopolysaccharide/colanic/teichoic acid biosynthesis glycosyltransferase